MSDAEEVKFSLKVMINKEKNKVLFAQVDSDFADVLLSFLTLPLGRIVKVLEKHYGDETPIVGSLNTLYNGLANLDRVHLWTEGAKLILLSPTSSFEAECKRLKLDISDSQPAEYFRCQNCGRRFRSVSMYYDVLTACTGLGCGRRIVVEKESQAAVSDDGVFTMDTAAFIISDDLQMLPNVTGLLQTFSILGIRDIDEAELLKATFGFNEIMDLLKASLISRTPLSDVILNKTSQMNSATVKFEPENLLHQIEKEKTSNSKKMILKVMVRRSTNKILFAQAEDDFIEFLFSFLTIPLGGVECLLDGKTSIWSIDNLYRSIANLIDKKYFKTPDTKSRLIKPKLPHGCISKNTILPLAEECLPPDLYKPISQFSSSKFPKGRGNYIKGPRTYKVADDLTVTPFCIFAILSSLHELKIPISDVKELELQIGLEEALSILKASLTSTSALTNGLMKHILKKQPKQEYRF